MISSKGRETEALDHMLPVVVVPPTVAKVVRTLTRSRQNIPRPQRGAAHVSKPPLYGTSCR